jgi:hypothetical protein
VHSPLRIAVVGVGYRGLSALERILSHACASGTPVEALLVEPGELGVGVHGRDQPDYLLLNTVASQITAFSDSDMVAGAPTRPGPSFLEWCRQRNLAAPIISGSRRPADQAAEFFPRCVLGEYLAWSAKVLLASAPDWVSITTLHRTATDVKPDGRSAAVTLDDGTRWTVDLALITTGHGLPHIQHSKEAAIISRVYPLPDSVSHLASDSVVAIAGAGLTAIDVIGALTVGRGGEFRMVDGHLDYCASGDEPSLILFNRSGWLPCARPARPRARPARDAKFLTVDALQQLRENTSDGRLGFTAGVESLIYAEMLADGLDAADRVRVSRVLASEPPKFATSSGYRDAAVEQARWDLAQAELGLEGSLAKNRLESLRDFREELRAAVDTPGLTDAGHRRFFAVIPRLANRAAVGPQRERLAEVLALIETGVLRLGPGPSPTVVRNKNGWLLQSCRLAEPEGLQVDTMVTAHLQFPPDDDGDGALRGAIRAWAAPHPHDDRYLNLTRDGHVRALAGGVCSAVAVFGPPAEGASYYNNYVLWPGVWSRALTDLDRAIRPFFDRQRQPPGGGQ